MTVKLQNCVGILRKRPPNHVLHRVAGSWGEYGPDLVTKVGQSAVRAPIDSCRFLVYTSATIWNYLVQRVKPPHDVKTDIGGRLAK
jgi:hypothetical protein